MMLRDVVLVSMQPLQAQDEVALTFLLFHNPDGRTMHNAGTDRFIEVAHCLKMQCKPYKYIEPSRPRLLSH